MKRRYLSQCGWPTVAALLLVLLAPGCGGDDPAPPEPDPEVSMSLDCGGGIMSLAVHNSGGQMREPGLFIAAFEDGARDTLRLTLDADESVTCQLSNIHGGVIVYNEEWDLEAAAGDCLRESLDYLVTSVNLSSLIPSPLTQMNILTCVYTIRLTNFAYNNAAFQLIRTDDGLTLKIVYNGITGNLAATSPGLLCPDLTGTISISSIVVETRIDISDGDDPQVTLGDTQVAVNGFHVNADGTFGFIVDWITTWFQGSFTNIVDDAMTSAINSFFGEDLSEMVVARTACAE